MTLLCFFDTGYDVTFVNCTCFFDKVLTKKILKIITLLKVRDIETSKHKLNKFISRFFYFSDIDSTNCLAYTHIHREFYLVDGLKANLLVGNNILAIERVVIDLANKFAMISSC